MSRELGSEARSSADVPARGVTLGSPIAPFLAFLLVLLGAGSLWARCHVPSPGIDFYQFWLAGRALAASASSDVYSSAGREALASLGRELASRGDAGERLRAAAEARPQVETFSTPLLYSAFSLLGRMSYERAFTTLAILSLVAACGSTIFLSRAAGLGSTTSLLLLATLLLGCKPLLSDFQVGNVAAIQLGLVAVYLALLRSRGGVAAAALAGALATVSVLLKPNLALAFALPPVARAVDRRFGALAAYAAGVAAGLALAIVSTLASAGTLAPWVHWFAALRSVESASDLSLGVGNVSLARFVTDLGGPDLSVVLTTLGLAAVGWTLWRSRGHAPSEARDALLVGAGAAVVLAGSRLSWLHYHVLLLPLVAALLASESPVRSPGRALLIGCGIVLWLGAPIDVLRWSGPAFPALESFAAIVILLGLALRGIGAGSAAPTAGPLGSTP